MASGSSKKVRALASGASSEFAEKVATFLVRELLVFVHTLAVPGSHQALYQVAPRAPLAAARVPRRPWMAPTTIPRAFP